MSETAPSLTEAQIERGLRDLLERLGFTCFHTRFALGSDPGFPDLVAIRERDGVLAAVEVKGPRGRLRPGQSEWIARFRAVPGCCFAEVVGPETTDAWLGYDAALSTIQTAVGGGPDAADHA